MDLENIKRGLRAEIKKRENEQYTTFQCNVRQMCKDVLAKLEEQESVLAEKDKVIADLEESHKMEVEQLLMEIVGLKKLVETADKLLKQKGGFTVKDITIDGVKLEGFKKEVTNAVDKSNA